ncbi:VacJ family lipoprotein [Candidatus Hepatincolaceae symbiont of Richtersius coronifer]
MPKIKYLLSRFIICKFKIAILINSLLLFFLLTLVPLKAIQDEFGDIIGIAIEIDEFGHPTAGVAGEDFNISDPIEPFNRGIFHTYNFLYKKAGGKVIIKGYTKLPKPLRKSFRNFVDNLTEPVNALNHLLQFKVQAFSETIIRFSFNTTFGMLGFFDFMQLTGLNRKPNDFGATLYTYGFNEGFYLLLLGPSTLRDSIGSFGNQFLRGVYLPNDITFAEQAIYILNAGENYINYENLMDNSLDPYILARDTFIQIRRQDLRIISEYK